MTRKDLQNNITIKKYQQLNQAYGPLQNLYQE
jgi:hypothetical protein